MGKVKQSPSDDPATLFAELVDALHLQDLPAPLLEIINALRHPIRLRTIAILEDHRQYVSALARELGVSRPLLYMHLDRLERAGLVVGELELSDEGNAVKWYRSVPFELRITPCLIKSVVESGQLDVPEEGK